MLVTTGDERARSRVERVATGRRTVGAMQANDDESFGVAG
jgi:hypothetical protein